MARGATAAAGADCRLLPASLCGCEGSWGDSSAATSSSNFLVFCTRLTGVCTSQMHTWLAACDRCATTEMFFHTPHQKHIPHQKHNKKHQNPGGGLGMPLKGMLRHISRAIDETQKGLNCQ